jgi:hypothetical protein
MQSGIKNATLIEDVISNNFAPSNRNNVNSNRYNPSSITDMTRQKINDMYSNFIMTKVGQYENYGIYKALVDSYTAGPSKYVVAIVPNDVTPLGGQKPLSALKWESFQTRSTTSILKEFNNMEVRPQSYRITQENNVSDNINLIDERRTHYIYVAENLPLKIEVLKIKPEDVFSERGTVTSALELYQTVVTIEN